MVLYFIRSVTDSFTSHQENLYTVTCRVPTTCGRKYTSNHYIKPLYQTLTLNQVPLPPRTPILVPLVFKTIGGIRPNVYLTK